VRVVSPVQEGRGRVRQRSEKKRQEMKRSAEPTDPLGRTSVRRIVIAIGFGTALSLFIKKSAYFSGRVAY